MKIGGIILGAFCAIAASYVSVHFFLDPDLEYQHLTSSDGVLQVQGYVYDTQRLSLEEEQSSVISVPLLGNRYHVFPAEAVFAQPLDVSFLGDAHHAVLYRWNAEGGYWVPLQQQGAPDGDGYIHVSLSEGGMYALGENVSVTVPTFIDVLEDLRSRLPQNAVAYSVRSIVTPSSGVPFLLNSALERGGCGGIPTAGANTLSTQEERTVQILVNDVLTSVSFTFLMEIDAAPGGCPEDMPMSVLL